MELLDLRSLRPKPLVRVMLVAEVVLFVAGMLGYIWLLMPHKGADVRWYQPAVAVLLAAVPIALNLLHGDRPADSGIRLDNLAASAKEVAIATAILATVAVALALVWDGWRWKGWPRLAELSGLYLGWGLAQQYLLQAFALRRFMQAGLPAAAAVVLAAGLFGLLHAPNWLLVAVTTGAGLVWCRLFLRRPNILTLGLSHAALAVLLYHVWYVPICRLMIGPMYLEKMR